MAYRKRKTYRKRRPYKGRKSFKRRSFTRRQATNGLIITCPLEARYTFNIEEKKEWSAVNDVNVLELSYSALFNRLKTQYNQFKINSVQIVMTPVAFNSSNDRYKLWSLNDRQGNNWTLNDEKNYMEAGGFANGSIFVNNPVSKQTSHIHGQKSSHRVYLKASTLIEKITYFDTNAFGVRRAKDATGEPVVNAVLGSGILDSLNPAGFTPHVKFAFQRLNPGTNAEIIYCHASLRFNVSFKGFNYTPLSVMDTADATINDPT